MPTISVPFTELFLQLTHICNLWPYYYFIVLLTGEYSLIIFSSRFERSSGDGETALTWLTLADGMDFADFCLSDLLLFPEEVEAATGARVGATVGICTEGIFKIVAKSGSVSSGREVIFIMQ